MLALEAAAEHSCGPVQSSPLVPARFSPLALYESSWHFVLFSPGIPSMFAWFGILSILALMSIVLVVGSMRLGFDREPSAGTLISGAP